MLHEPTKCAWRTATGRMSCSQHADVSDQLCLGISKIEFSSGQLKCGTRSAILVQLVLHCAPIYSGGRTKCNVGIPTFSYISSMFLVLPLFTLVVQF